MQPCNYKDHYFEKNLLMVLNLKEYVRNVISFFLKQRPGEMQILRTFWRIKIQFWLIMLEKSAIMMSLHKRDVYGKG